VCLGEKEYILSYKLQFCEKYKLLASVQPANSIHADTYIGILTKNQVLTPITHFKNLFV